MNSLDSLEIQEWLNDVNLAITYLLTNFNINKIVKSIAFLHLITTYSNILGTQDNIFP